MKYFNVIDFEGNQLTSNLLPECHDCYESCKSNHKIVKSCPKFKHKRRQGIIKNTKGIVFNCCDKTKTTKLFKSKLEALSYSMPELRLQRELFMKEVKDLEQRRIKRLVHNLTSINAYNIQEIYDIASQDILTSDYKNQLKYIKNQIIEIRGNMSFITLFMFY